MNDLRDPCLSQKSERRHSCPLSPPHLRHRGNRFIVHGLAKPDGTDCKRERALEAGMRLFGFRVLAAAFLLVTSFAHAQKKVPLYRMVCRSGEHFYTTSAPERTKAERDGCRTEGEVGLVSSTQAPGLVPVYRLVSTGKVGGHFLTTSSTEREEVIKRLHYKPEGTAFYLIAKQAPGTEPLYRMLDPHTEDHFYTASAAEEREAKERDGFKTEGVLGYVWPTTPEKQAKRTAH